MDTIVHMTFVLDRALHRQLCKLADTSRRSESWIVEQALRRYLAAEEAAMAEGTALTHPCADAGRP